MQDLDSKPRPAARDRRAALASHLSAARASRRTAGRVRRGSASTIPDVWRKTELGTNHIACFGVWRRGTRRQAERSNRSGTTRWHMPHRSGASTVLSGARHEAVNED